MCNNIGLEFDCILILKCQFEREILPRPPKLKVCFHWNSHHCGWPFDPLAASQQEHLCVCGRKNKQKAFTKFRRPSDSVSQQGGWEGVTCVSTTLASLPSCSGSVENEQKSLLLLPSSSHWRRWPTLFHWHLVLAHPNVDFLLCREFPENQICAPQKSDFSGKKIFSSNLTNPKLLKWLTVSVRRREAYWQSRLSWPEEASTRTQDPTSRGRTLPTIRGLWSSNHIGIWKPQTEYCKKFNWSLPPIQLVPKPEPC